MVGTDRKYGGPKAPRPTDKKTMPRNEKGREMWKCRGKTLPPKRKTRKESAGGKMVHPKWEDTFATVKTTLEKWGGEKPLKDNSGKQRTALTVKNKEISPGRGKESKAQFGTKGEPNQNRT